MNRKHPPRLGRALLCAALALTFAAPARAQFGGNEAIPPPEELVQVTTELVSLKAGGAGEAVLTVRIAPGWHINANPPSPDMIPTSATVVSGTGVGIQAPVYPAARKAKLSFSDEELLVYDGTVVLRLPLAAVANAPEGRQSLRGTLSFQACNDQVCLPPARAPFTLQVEVTGSAGPAAASAAGATPPADTTVARAPPPPAAAALTDSAGAILSTPGNTAPPPGRDPGDRLRGALEKGGVWWFLALFAGGLALNLTPCVFPMLGITVSVFGARRQEPPVKVLSHASAYVIGIAVTYSVLGVIAALTGGLFGALLQNAWVNVALGGLFLVLALSMFGLYEFQPPPGLLTKLGGANTGSIAGIFLSGLAVGVIAAPCVGPFVVAVLALIAQRGDTLFGFQTMFAMSLGLGVPYLFLALFSNLLQSLPRSGDWMLWVKQVFGVLMVAIGLNYILIGLLPVWSPWVTPVALVLGGLYLGFVARHGSRKPRFRTFKWALGAAAIAGGVFAGIALRAEGVRFEHYQEEAVQAAFASGRPVIMDFSATWCLPCHELDRHTFTHREVIDLSRRFAVFKVDLTRYDSPEAQSLRKRFGVTGVPEVLFFTPDGDEVRVARVVGFIPPQPFLERMRYVLENREQPRLDQRRG